MLNLDLPIARPREALVLEFQRELGAGDLATYHGSVGKAQLNQIKRLRDTHHTLARSIASGMTQIEAANFCGRTPASVHILMQDPTFLELVETYRATQTHMEVSFLAKLKGVGLDALDEIQTRLDTEPEQFDPKALMSLVELSADRIGHGKQSSTTNLNVNVDLASRLEAARKRLVVLDE